MKLTEDEIDRWEDEHEDEADAIADRFDRSTNDVLNLAAAMLEGLTDDQILSRDYEYQHQLRGIPPALLLAVRCLVHPEKEEK